MSNNVLSSLYHEAIPILEHLCNDKLKYKNNSTQDSSFSEIPNLSKNDNNNIVNKNGIDVKNHIVTKLNEIPSSPPTLNADLKLNCENQDDKNIKINDMEIEAIIKKQKSVPILIFEYDDTADKSNLSDGASKSQESEFVGWDIQDMREVFSQFGELLHIEVNGKIAIVFYKLFLDAYSTKEYFSDMNNFKDNKSNFKTRWFEESDKKYISDEMKSSIHSFIVMKDKEANKPQTSKFPVNCDVKNACNSVLNNKLTNTQNQEGTGYYTQNSLLFPNNMSWKIQMPLTTGSTSFNSYTDKPNIRLDDINLNGGTRDCFNNNDCNSYSSISKNIRNGNKDCHTTANLHEIMSTHAEAPSKYNKSPKKVNYGQTQNQFINENNNMNNYYKQLLNQKAYYGMNLHNVNSNINDSSFTKSSNIQSQLQGQLMYSSNYYENIADKYNCTGKYTCKFEIQIENEKEFQVARRIIGSKGYNMKRIVDICSHNNGFIYDAVKLRLRGQGSGFKEGPCNKESDEPLHLCISSKFYDRYILANNLVCELLNNIYDEYYAFCSKIWKLVTKLDVKREEGLATCRKISMTNNLIDPNNYAVSHGQYDIYKS